MQIFPNAKEVRFIQRGMSKLHKSAIRDFQKEVPQHSFDSQGFGYVDFETGQRNEFRYPTTLEKNKLFVNNVHYDATSEQVKVYSSIVFGWFYENVALLIDSRLFDCSELRVNEGALRSSISTVGKSARRVIIYESHQRSKIDLVPRALSRGKADAPKPEEVDLLFDRLFPIV
uniref:Uncharacterized protein n=1 Tax=Parascaris equorum TaxID=6256 RepID=A0A914S5V7_PAREQ